MNFKPLEREEVIMMRNRWGLIFFVGLVLGLFVVGTYWTTALALEGKAGEVIKTVEDLKELQAKGLLTEGQVIMYSELVRDFGSL